MNAILTRLFGILFIILLVQGCRKEDKGAPPSSEAGEYKFLSIAITDAVSNELKLLNPSTNAFTTMPARYPNAALYPTDSRRYAALVFGTQNLVNFFDCGYEFHGDHVDIKGTPKFAAMSGSGNKPTHFKSRGEQSLVFNDGDGTLSLCNEADFHTSGATMHTINAGLHPHHGAMAPFDNGSYAVTVTDPQQTAGGPHGVKIIDVTGTELFPVKLGVSRLHGNATDGNNALFGVEGGVLVVKSNGDQRIISNPAGFGDTRLGTILEARRANTFIGYTAAKGVYVIDIHKDVISPLLESDNVMQCKVDYTGRNLIALLHSGEVKIFDLSVNRLKKEGTIIPATNTAETLKPSIEASTKYLYITRPMEGELWKVNIDDFSKIDKVNLGGQPSRLVILGFETNESH